MNRNILLPVLFILFFLVSCKNQQSKQVDVKPKIIRIGYIYSHIPVMLGRELGWFKDEFINDSIKIEYHLFEIGPSIIEAFAGDRIDIATVGDQPAIVGWSNGIPIKAIGNFASGYKLAGLAVSETAGIHKLSDLKGKKIATAVGSVYQHLLYQFLVKAGLKYSDIKLVNLKFGESVSALASKNIDAVVIGEPYLSQIEFKKIGKVFAYSDGLMYFSDPIVVSAILDDLEPQRFAGCGQIIIVIKSIHAVGATGGHCYHLGVSNPTQVILEPGIDIGGLIVRVIGAHGVKIVSVFHVRAAGTDGIAIADLPEIAMEQAVGVTQFMGNHPKVEFSIAPDTGAANLGQAAIGDL